jgi:hypothetical protein
LANRSGGALHPAASKTNTMTPIWTVLHDIHRNYAPTRGDTSGKEMIPIRA